MYFVRLVQNWIARFVLPAIAAALAIGLPWSTAMLIYAPLVIALSAVGAWMMYTLPIDRVTTKNRAAAILLPWGNILGPGPVEKHVLVSTTLSLLWGIAAIAIAHYLSIPSNGDRSGTLAAIIGWIVLASSALYYLQMRMRHAGSPMRSLKVFAKVMLAVLCVAGLSVGLFIAGWPWASMAVAIAPLAIVTVSMLPLLFIILIASLRGKPLRWN